MPLQELCNVISMIPKKDADIRMVAAQGSHWRNECKVGSQEDSEWNESTAPQDDAARAGSSFLRTMEDRQRLIDLLSACGANVMVGIWDLWIFYDSIPLALVRSELNLMGYGKHNFAGTWLAHGAPMILKAGQKYSDFTEARCNGIVLGCQRPNTIARAVALLGLERTGAFTRNELGARILFLRTSRMFWIKLRPR